MGLLGKSFKGFIREQVKIRQKALGEHTSRFSKKNNTKAFLTSTPWIKLSSSVNLIKSDDGVYNQMEESQLFEDVSKFEGSELAKNFILFGGVSKYGASSITNNPYSGLNSSKSKLDFGGAYGFGSWRKLFNYSGEGYKPMPGITNVEFSYKNDGALSQGTVTIKAFSRAQFQIIDVLYQRPGYTVLLEFGHSVFVDNKGITQYAGKGGYSFTTSPFEMLFNPGTEEPLNHYNLTSLIQDEKEKWEGNYEGAFMKITKFSWKYNEDGSYDITVNLIGMGDVISSLKTNVIPLKFQDSLTEDEKEKRKELLDGGNFIVGNANSTRLNRELYSIYNGTRNIDFDDDSFIGKSKKVFGDDFFLDNFPFPVLGENGLVKDFKKATLTILNGVFVLDDPDLTTDIDDYDNKCYITFGLLISLLAKYVNLKTKDGVPLIYYDLNYVYTPETVSERGKEVGITQEMLDRQIAEEEEEEKKEAERQRLEDEENTFNGVVLGSPEPEYFQGQNGINGIDRPNLNNQQYQLAEEAKQETASWTTPEGNSLEKDYNYLATFPGNMSSNPINILIPFKPFPDSVLSNITKTAQNTYSKLLKTSKVKIGLDEYNAEFFVEDDNTKGRLDRVLLDINYIAKILNNNTTREANKHGECNLIDFLNQILSDINNDLGGINNFRVLYDQDKQMISFPSELPANTEPNNTEELSIINTLGLRKTGTEYEGSFVKNVDLKAELNDDFATQISVGAQNNSNRLQGNAGSFSSYNKGLEDRVIPEKLDSQLSNPDDIKDTISSEDLIEGSINDEYMDALDELYNDVSFEDEYISLIRETNSTLCPLIIGELAKIKQYPAPFFLPFNLGLTLHGLGGVRIYDAFRVDGKMLPPSYDPEKISLIVKSLSHSVSLGGWSTKIETFPKPNSTLTPIPSNKVGLFPGYVDGKLINYAASKIDDDFLKTPINENDPDRLKAIKQSFNGVFSKHGQEGGMCARWTYNLALNYCRALKKDPTIPGKQLAAGGNASMNLGYWRGLVKLGYTQTKVGSNISKQKAIELVSKTKWGYGDIVVYYAYDGDPEASHIMYGHTQIYVGSLTKKLWSSSKKENYFSNFVYRSRNSNKWDLLVFRAPENASQVKI